MKEQSNLDELSRFIVICTLSLTLFAIVTAVLFSLIFVTQPLNSMAPNDAEFFKLITPIAAFITGSLSSVVMMSKKDKKDSNDA